MRRTESMRKRVLIDIRICADLKTITDTSLIPSADSTITHLYLWWSDNRPTPPRYKKQGFIAGMEEAGCCLQDAVKALVKRCEAVELSGTSLNGCSLGPTFHSTNPLLHERNWLSTGKTLPLTRSIWSWGHCLLSRFMLNACFSDGSRNLYEIHKKTRSFRLHGTNEWERVC